MAMVGNLSGNDLVGDHVHLFVIVALIGQSCHFCEYAAANIVYRAVYTSHIFFLPCPAAVAFCPGSYFLLQSSFASVK